MDVFHRQFMKKVFAHKTRGCSTVRSLDKPLNTWIDAWYVLTCYKAHEKHWTHFLSTWIVSSAMDIDGPEAKFHPGSGNKRTTFAADVPCARHGHFRCELYEFEEPRTTLAGGRRFWHLRWLLDFWGGVATRIFLGRTSAPFLTALSTGIPQMMGRKMLPRRRQRRICSQVHGLIFRQRQRPRAKREKKGRRKRWTFTWKEDLEVEAFHAKNLLLATLLSWHCWHTGPVASKVAKSGTLTTLKWRQDRRLLFLHCQAVSSWETLHTLHQRASGWTLRTGRWMCMPWQTHRSTLPKLSQEENNGGLLPSLWLFWGRRRSVEIMGCNARRLPPFVFRGVCSFCRRKWMWGIGRTTQCGAIGVKQLDQLRTHAGYIICSMWHHLSFKLKYPTGTCVAEDVMCLRHSVSVCSSHFI